jgi:cbb3-type cytochrome oxidase subunit 3
MMLHRTESYALIWLTLCSLLLVWPIAGVLKQKY